VIELRISADDLQAIARKLALSIPNRLYSESWRQIKAQLERIKPAPHLEPDPIRLPADDPEEFLDWLRSNGFGHIADGAIMLPAPGGGS
jgi:hypothetical protein